MESGQPKKIIVDTNAWLGIAEFKIDLFSELERMCDFRYTICVLEGTLKELDKVIAEQRLKFRQAAKLAKQLIAVKNVLVLEGSGYVDDVLVKHSKERDLVLTQDIELKKRLQRPYLTIRQKKTIIIVV